MKKYLKILYSQIKTDFFFINFVSDLDHFEVIKKIVKKTIEPLRSRDQKNLRDHPSIRNCKQLTVEERIICTYINWLNVFDNLDREKDRKTDIYTDINKKPETYK